MKKTLTATLLTFAVLLSTLFSPMTAEAAKKRKAPTASSNYFITISNKLFDYKVVTYVKEYTEYTESGTYRYTYDNKIDLKKQKVTVKTKVEEILSDAGDEVEDKELQYTYTMYKDMKTGQVSYEMGKGYENIDAYDEIMEISNRIDASNMQYASDVWMDRMLGEYTQVFIDNNTKAKTLKDYSKFWFFDEEFDVDDYDEDVEGFLLTKTSLYINKKTGLPDEAYAFWKDPQTYEERSVTVYGITFKK